MEYHKVAYSDSSFCNYYSNSNISYHCYYVLAYKVIITMHSLLKLYLKSILFFHFSNANLLNLITFVVKIDIIKSLYSLTIIPK